MYVCVCRAVTDRQIIAAAERGTERLADLRKELGVPGDCGRCARCAKALLRQGVESRRLQTLTAAAFSRPSTFNLALEHASSDATRRPIAAASSPAV
jgi:bacterioferritin-associated ferredoxin